MATTNVTFANWTSDFADGVAVTPAIGKKVRIQLSGTFTANDKINLIVLANSQQYDLGNNDMMGVQPTFVMAYDEKVWIVDGDRFLMSGIGEPTGWEFRFAGFGWVRVTGRSGNSREIKALTVFNNRLAVLTRSNVQIWFIDPDPANMYLRQTLESVGTTASKAAISFGDSDVFFPHDSGVRSLRLRENIDLLSVADVGTPIDSLVVSETKTLTDTQKETQGLAFLNLVDSRYILRLSATAVEECYVFSYFPGSNIAAWSKYKMQYGVDENGAVLASPVSFDMQNAVVYNGDLYFRADVGGTDSLVKQSRTVVDKTQATVVMPYFAAKTPGTDKYFRSIDIVGSGTWTLYAKIPGSDWLQLDTITLSTAGMLEYPLMIEATHIQLKFVSGATAETALLSAVQPHYGKQKAG